MNEPKRAGMGAKVKTEHTVSGKATTFSMSVDALLCRCTAQARYQQ